MKGGYELIVHQDYLVEGCWRVSYQELDEPHNSLGVTTATEGRAHEIAHYLIATRDVTPFAGLIWGVRAILAGQDMDI